MPRVSQWSQENKVLLESYSPLGSTGAPQMEDPVVKEIAAAHGATPAQVLISWQAARGIVVLPKSVTPDRIKSNFEGASLLPYPLQVSPYSVNSLTLPAPPQRSS